MRYGICFGIEHPEQIDIAKKSGFDYIECGFCTLSRGDEELFNDFKRELLKNDIKCECANGFLPRDLTILDEGYNEEKITAYIEKGMKRGSEIGLTKIAFGSSKARALPNNMKYSDGMYRLGQFLGNVVSPIAEKYGMTIVTEPLRGDECNIVNSLKEGVLLSVISGKSNISCLADLYHAFGEGDTNETIRSLKGCLAHGHISNPHSRKGLKRDFPLDEGEWDYRGFIDALSFAGVETCSVEAQCIDFETEAVLSGKFLKSL